MKLSGYKKLFLLGVILLIIAGAFVVSLKGMKVSLELQQHESILLKIGKAVDLNDIKEICNDVFNNKKYIAKNVEMFDDSINILVEAITDEEKENLVNKINEKYGTEFAVQDLTVRSNSNVRIRDIVFPYLFPIICSVILVGATYLIIYRNKKTMINYVKALASTLVLEAVIASVVAITRVPLSQSIITIMLFVAVAQIMIYMNKNK